MLVATQTLFLCILHDLPMRQALYVSPLYTVIFLREGSALSFPHSQFLGQFIAGGWSVLLSNKGRPMVVKFLSQLG